ELIREVGLVATMSRFGGLPIDLTDTYAEALALMPAKQRRRAMRAIRHMLMGSPVGVVHIARLWNRVSPSDRLGLKVRKRLAEVCATEDALKMFDAWLAVLRWTDEQFGFNHAAREFATDIRLALVWTHADRVFRILLARGLEAEWIRAAFSDSDY